MDFSGVLSAATTITTIIGLALAGLQRGVVTNLRETNRDLRDRDSDRDKREKDLEAENAALKADLSALGRVVTGEAYLHALSDQIAAQGQDLQQHRANLERKWDAATEVGQEILEELRNLGSQREQ